MRRGVPDCRRARSARRGATDFVPGTERAAAVDEDDRDRRRDRSHVVRDGRMADDLRAHRDSFGRPRSGFLASDRGAARSRPRRRLFAASSPPVRAPFARPAMPGRTIESRPSSKCSSPRNTSPSCSRNSADPKPPTCSSPQPPRPATHHRSTARTAPGSTPCAKQPSSGGCRG